MKRLTLFCIILCIFSATFLTAAQDDLAAIERADGVTLHIESLTYQETAGRYTPANGIYLVMLMTIDNPSAKDVCIAASDIRLLYDADEYPPERALMAEVQADLDPFRDYVGPFGGHCVDAGATELSFAAFDVPAAMESFAIRFDDTTQEFADLADVTVGNPVGIGTPVVAATVTPRPSIARPTATPPAVTEGNPVGAASSESADAAALTDGIFILAGGRDVRTVQVVDGRDKGGERVAIISFIVTEATTQGLSDEIIDILRAVAATIRADDLDLDSILLVLGDAAGNSIGTAATYVDDLLDYHQGNITRDVYFEMILFTPL